MSLDMASITLVACGGAIGALIRGTVTSILKSQIGEKFPFPTLIINAIACFIMGWLIEISLSSWLSAFMIIGILGGLSTMSTLYFETLSLWKSKEKRKALLYLFGSHMGCLISCALGMIIGSVVGF